MRVVELFAGVGGFRIGFEGPPESSDRSSFGVVWSNQWEPTTKKQHAAEVYVSRWDMEQSEDDPEIYSSGPDDVFVNKDIGTVEASDIPDHDLLCGGFPCQDYSVAKTASAARGLEGKKGVLWWEILRILEAKMPDYALLENVDRLLKSPTSQRGRDFAVMLASLDELGYVVEWRDFAASDYGFPQRRKRAYILAHAPGTQGHAALTGETSPKEWLEEKGALARAFPIRPLEAFFGMPGFSLRNKPDDNLADITDGFLPQGNGLSKFMNAGVMVDGTVWTSKVESSYDGNVVTLGDVLVTPGKVGDDFVVRPEDMLKENGWVYLKGAKSEPRKGSEGFTYDYKEGPITFPDALDRPSRTMVTGEGGSTPSRFKHVVEFRPTKGQVERLDLRNDEAMEARERLGMSVTKWLRRLTPVELERLNGFPDGHTEGVTDAKRAFFMGNALVCGLVQCIGNVLSPGPLYRLEAIQTDEIVCKSYLSALPSGVSFRDTIDAAHRLCPELKEYCKSNEEAFNGSGGKDKGTVGKMVEFYIFGQLPDTDPNPDLAWGADIKATHFKTAWSKGFNAKERVTITNCGDENDYSSFDGILDAPSLQSCKYYPKVRKGVLFVFEHREGKYNDIDINLTKTLLCYFAYDLETMPEEVTAQLNADFEHIKSTIRAGAITQAGQIFLHTAPHGSGHGSGTRALAFNNKFVTKLVSIYARKPITVKGTSWFIEKRHF